MTQKLQAKALNSYDSHNSNAKLKIGAHFIVKFTKPLQRSILLEKTQRNWRVEQFFLVQIEQKHPFWVSRRFRALFDRFSQGRGIQMIHRLSWSWGDRNFDFSFNYKLKNRLWILDENLAPIFIKNSFFSTSQSSLFRRLINNAIPIKTSSISTCHKPLNSKKSKKSWLHHVLSHIVSSFSTEQWKNPPNYNKFSPFLPPLNYRNWIIKTFFHIIIVVFNSFIKKTTQVKN